MRLTSKGQVTVPQAIREMAGLAPGCEVEFYFDNGRVCLKKVATSPADRRERILAALDAATATATANRKLRTDDILRMTRDED